MALTDATRPTARSGERPGIRFPWLDAIAIAVLMVLHSVLTLGDASRVTGPGSWQAWLLVVLIGFFVLRGAVGAFRQTTRYGDLVQENARLNAEGIALADKVLGKDRD